VAQSTVYLFSDDATAQDQYAALTSKGDALSPFDEDLRADLTSKVSRRLASELG